MDPSCRKLRIWSITMSLIEDSLSAMNCQAPAIPPVAMALTKSRPCSIFDMAALFAVSDVPTLAFDHAAILDTALKRLQGKVRYEPIGFELLPPKFTLSQLQRVYETVLERPLDKRNFRKKILAIGRETRLLVELDEVQQDVAHRAARLYRFDEEKYRRAKRKGFNFEI